MTRLVVIGGGITGLSAAWQGVQRGAEVSVIEADHRLGGKITTQTTSGFLVEQGPDSFVAYRPAALQLIGELGLGDEVIAAGAGRRVQILSRGKLRPLPAGMGMVLPTRIMPFATTSVLSVRDKLRAGVDLFLPRRLGADDVAIGAFLRARLGAGIVQRFADPMIGGIYGAGVDELSLDAVLPSLRESEQRYRSLVLASLAAGRAARCGVSASRGAASSPFRTLRGGLGSLVDALADRLAEAGAEIRCGVRVSAVEPGRVHLADGTRVDADAVVLAGGVRSSAALLRAQVPAASAALAEVPLASTALVSLAWPSSAFDAPVESQGWLEADPGPVSGVTISSVKFPGRAPDGQVLLRVFVPDKRGPLAGAASEEIAGVVVAHVRRWLRVSGEPSLQQVTRWQQVMPKYTVGHPARAQRVDEALRRARPRWAVAGSALHGVGVPDCVADGRRRADLVLDAG